MIQPSTSKASILGAFSLALLGACGPGPTTPRAPEPLADPLEPGTPIRFAGSLELRGSLAREVEGAIWLSVRPLGGGPPLLARSYAVLDPAWARRGPEKTLLFGLGTEDAVVASLAVVGRTMEIVARYDADGNPATDEPESVEVVARARTGDLDVEITLARREPDPARTAQTGAR